jgi:hypothetical protein
LGQKLGVNKNTIQEYSKGKGDFKGVALAAIVRDFGINGEWLMVGSGEPFSGAHEKYPEVCGSPCYAADQQVIDYAQAKMPGVGVSPDAMFSSNQKLNIEEAMGKTYKVLTAGTSLSVALYMNIQQFALALDTGQALQICMEQAKDFQKQIDELKSKVDRLSAAPSSSEGQGDGSESEKVA